MKLNNRFFLMRHGRAVSNVKNIVSCWPEKFYNPITKQGKQQVKKSAAKLKNKHIDLIFASDLLRTKMTSEIVGKALKIKPKFDKRIREQYSGVFNGRPFQELKDFFGKRSPKRFKLKVKKGETYIDIQKRTEDFFDEKNKKYKGKNILIISHELPLVFLEAYINGIKNKDFFKKEREFETAQVKEFR